MLTKIMLDPDQFHDRPETIVETESFKVIAYRFSTGVCGLDISNGRCMFTILPYQGQQIWRISFDDKDYTMKSIFDEPQDTQVFDLTYGAFLIHCGLTAMGNPGPEDDHPMHGELPNAHYQKAFLECGEDTNGKFIRVSGSFTYRNGLETYYVYTPSLCLHENSTILEARDTIENKRSQPFEFMYMSHINWRPVEHAKIVYSTVKDKNHRIVYHADWGDSISAVRRKKLETYTESLQTNPDIGDTIDSKTQVYDPELCSLMKYSCDKYGWAHAMMLQPDGNACYVRFETKYMPNALRWVARTGDEDAFGFCLPTTGNHLGKAYAIAHGLRKKVKPHSTIVLRYDFGILSSQEALRVKKKIESIIK